MCEAPALFGRAVRTPGRSWMVRLRHGGDDTALLYIHYTHYFLADRRADRDCVRGGVVMTLVLVFLWVFGLFVSFWATRKKRLGQTGRWMGQVLGWEVSRRRTKSCILPRCVVSCAGDCMALGVWGSIYLNSTPMEDIG